MIDQTTPAQAEDERRQKRTRRRFARRQWTRRWVRWRLLVAAVLVLVLVGGGVWLVGFSDRLSVHHVDVEGTSLLTKTRVERVAAIPEGQQVAFVDLVAAQRRIEGLAEVRSAEVTRAWPDGVLITVTERTPIAVVELGGRIRGLDASGVVFRQYKSRPADLPVVRPTTSTGTDALEEAAGVVAALPADLAKRVDHVEVETIDQITLVLRDGRQVLWGSAEQSDLKAEVLDELLVAQEAKTYDVSVPGSPVTRAD